MGRRSRACLVTTAIALLIGAVAAQGAGRHFTGTLDPSFGRGGKAVADLGPTFALSTYGTLMRQADGDLMLGGVTERFKGGLYNEEIAFLQRRNADGSIDAGFGGGLVKLPGVSDLVDGGEGRVYAAIPLGGGFCGSSGAVWRLLPDGTRDARFGEGGRSVELPIDVSQIAVDPQGGILVAGSHHYGECPHGGSSPTQPALARLRPNGSLDPSFGKEGLVLVPDQSELAGGVTAGLAVREDGGIVIAAEGSVRVFTPAGAPDPGFGDNGSVTVDGTARGLAGLPNDEVVLAVSAGEPSCCSRPSRFTISRYLPDGGLDPSFGGGSVSLPAGMVDALTALAGEPDGSILLGGEVGTEDCPGESCDPRPVIVRLTTEGELDPSFGEAGVVRPSLPASTRSEEPHFVADFALAPGGQILFAGGSGDGGEATVSALRPDGSPDLGFGSGGRASEAEALPSTTEPLAQELAIGSRGTILVRGWSNAGEHREHSILLAFSPDGVLKKRPEPADTTAELAQNLQVDGKGRFYGNSSAYVTRFDGTGRLDGSYGAEGKASLPSGFHCWGMVVRHSGEALALGRYRDRPGMAAFEFDPRGRPEARFGHGGLAFAGFGKHAGAVALTAAYDRRGRIVLYGRKGRVPALARLLPNGHLDRGFAKRGRQLHLAGLYDLPYAVLRTRGNAIYLAVAGEIDRTDARTSIFRFRADGTRDRSFGHGGIVQVNARSPLVGFFAGRRLTLLNALGYWDEGGLAIRVFNADGSVSRSFGHRGARQMWISGKRPFRPVAAVRARDGRIVVAGARGYLEEAGAQIELLRLR